MAKKPANDRKRRIDEIKRRQARKERRRTVIALVVALLLGGALVGGAVWSGRESKVDARPINEVGVRLADAGCGEVENLTPRPPAGGHVERGQTVDYTDYPPAGGDHVGSATLGSAPRNFYDRDAAAAIPEHAVHSLEHGGVAVWYDNKLPDAEVELLRVAAASLTNKRIFFLPWKRADFTGDKHVAMTSWGHRQRCSKVSGEAIAKFHEDFLDHQDAPERGQPF